jgi:hypothetical protein
MIRAEGPEQAAMPGWTPVMRGTGTWARPIRYDQMAAAISDCSTLICGEMGQGAYDRTAANLIRPIVTDLRDVDEAAIECAAGRIVNHSERLH